MIGIIDYGMGNLHSVSKALERLDLSYFLSEDPEELEKADGLILPGVGSFRDAMTLLKEKQQEEFIKTWAADGKPLLGICLGMQLLFEGSEENGDTEGLGFLPGYARLFKGKSETGEAYKVPHMGWNKLEFQQPEHDLLQDTEEGHVYFVHSYVIETPDKDVLVAASDYYQEVPAVVGRGRVMGTQFHPEKSSRLGMKMLDNFGKVVAEGSRTL
ncbi:imidazole glycerol phosphate synthase subunit HisH [Alteribacillus bidgolensis]|uniref:Imidazole glycerol phosphate synthase subunit HisH n=1 Tax=Alteribacillus bidgolensis TaxID=930129 RepID=A0A1G8E8H9_9BACI|nr:imidazole glycerol phosphate synthase subunit HisH [Alteribacillus bidgolensis]SDH66248.1 imidazole glycerol phosphate synthase subunit hisH [Alteribacillus bidgolensis]